MIEPFEYFEIDEMDAIFIKYPVLKINNSPAFYLILRGIIGNIKIEQSFRGTIFSQTQNFLNPKENDNTNNDINVKISKNIDYNLKTEILSLLEILRARCKSNLIVLPQYISDTCTLEDLSNVLSNKLLTNRNKKFFESLNSEFSNFYYHTSKESHTIAFLHLFRILEYISYSFPVMYAASTKDFSRSFDILKTLFSGDKDKGELKVFKDFISIVMSVETNYEKLSIDIDIISELDEYNERVYNTILNICDSKIFETSKNSKNSKISIQFSEFSSFIITIRNKFFHLKNSQDKNIQIVDIVDSDFFFNLINKKCAYFLSLVTLFVIKKAYF